MFLFAEVDHASLFDVVFDFKSNIINWLLLVGFIIYGWNKMVPSIMADRKRSIEDAIAGAQKSKKDAEVFLAEQEARIANAEKEAAKIADDAKTVAQQLKQEIADQTKRELTELEAKFQAAIANERQMAITELRTAAAKAAVELSRVYLSKNVSEEDNKILLSQFMNQLDSLSSQGQAMTPGSGFRESESVR